MADDFRSFLIVPCPPEMRRVEIDVSENEDGSELSYTAVDREVTYGTGLTSDVLEVVGTVTVGVDTPTKDVKSAAVAVAGGAWSAGRGIVGYFTGGLFGTSLLDSVKDVLGMVWNTAVPTNRCMGVARATGNKGASRATLERAALNVLLDRLSPVFNPDTKFGFGTMVSCYMTTNVDSENPPFVEMRAEVLGISPNILSAILTLNPSKLMKLDPTYTGPTGVINWGPNVGAAKLPADNNARGSWIRRLLVQTLRNGVEVYDLPDAPPANEDVNPSPPA